jgi:DHA1 family tetracycline resistance protein-like MFS transporter
MSPTWYYVVGGASGLISWMAVCLSALSDVLPPQWRAAGFGLLIAGFSLGFALSPILATLLNHLQVSITALSVLSIAWLTTIFFFPETLPPEVAAEAARVRRARPQSPTVWGRVLQALGRPFRELSILNRSSFFRILSALAFFSGMVSAGDQRLLIYYVEERLGFTDKDVALMFVLIGIPGIIVQGILIKPFIECLGEKHVIALCFMVGALDNVMYGLAGQKVTIFVAITISSFCGMAFPTISAVKSNNVEESEQGRIQGALYSLQALASGVGPMLLRLVYHFTKDSRFPGAGTMFIFAGSLYIVAAGFAMALPREKADSRIRNKESDTMESPAEGPETSLL